jgi:hypothetical protein
MPKGSRILKFRNLRPGNFPREICFNVGSNTEDDWNISGTHVGFIYFKAGRSAATGPNITLLSNLATVSPFFHGGFEYENAESAYMSRRVCAQDRYRFSIHGDLGSFEGLNATPSTKQWWAGLKFNQTKSEGVGFWEKNKMAGIIAKMSTKEDAYVQLGLTLDHGARPSKSDEWTLWCQILKAKYNADYNAKRVLLMTGDCLLIETDKSLGRLFKPEGVQRRSKWGGLVKDGVLLGDNRMGQYMCRVRTILQNQNTEVCA